MSTSAPILYTYRRCFNSKLIQIAAKFSNTKLELVWVDTLSETNVKKIVSKSPTGTFPVLQTGETFISGTVAISKFVLTNAEQVSEILYGKDNKRRALNDSWIDFTTYSVWPFYDEIIGQITGKLDANEDLFATAISDVLSVLAKIDRHLTFKSFLVDHQVSLADVVLATALHPYFTLVLDEKLRDSVPNVTRWFSFVSSVKEVNAILGRARLCQVTSKPAVILMTPLTKPVEVKAKEQKPQTKTEKKPQEVKKPANNATEEVVSTPQVEEDKKEKKKNPLDELPPTSLDLDSFKKEFLNTPEKKQVLTNFWHKYDSNGWSIWFLHYNRSGDQGQLSFKTCNLKSNFLQKLEKFRRYTFCAHGVYGAEPNLEVEGVWMWRGTEIPEELREHDSFNYITFKRLDHTTDRKFIEEFWLNLEENQIVNGRPVVDAEYFK